MDDKKSMCPQCGSPHGGIEGEPCATCLLRIGLESEPPTLSQVEPDANPATVPERVGNWRLIEQIGEGGMGVVYLAEEIGPLKRRGALKRIKHGLDSRRVLERFDQERLVLSRMNHTGIARAIDAGSADDGSPFFVMEYVSGLPITDYCDRHRLGSNARLELFVRLCDAVDHAHRRGILHRDLKPSNILVVDDEDGPRPKVIDFGIARAIAQQRLEWNVFTEFGRLVGTPEYMSPEQADLDNDDLDTRSDVYGLGVVLYELLVGKTPHDPRALRGLGLQALLRTVREGTFPTPSARLSTLGDEVGAIAESRGSDPDRLRRAIAGELDWIVMRATERDREQRYGSPRELGQDIRRFLSDLPILASPPGALYRARKFVRRHRVGVAIGVALLAGLLVFAGTMAWQARIIAHERDRARQEAETAERMSELLIRLFESTDPLAPVAGEMPTAREILIRGAQQARHSLAQEPEIRGRMFSALARALRGLGVWEQSTLLFSEAYETYAALGGTNDDRAIAALLGMARVNAGQRRVDEATRLYERVIAAHEERPDGDERQALQAAMEIGELYGIEGKFDEARSRLEATHRQLVEQFGADDFDTLATGLLIAFSASHAGSPEGSAEYVDAALAGMTLPEAYDEWKSHYFSRLGWICLIVNRFEDAARVYAALARYRESFLGPDHYFTQQVREQLADVYYMQGLYADSAELRAAVHESLVEVLGESHPSTMINLARYADTLYQDGQYERAEPLLRDVLGKWKPTGDNEFQIFRAKFALANTLRGLDRVDEAIPLWRETADYCATKLSEKFPVCRDNRAYLAEALGNASN